MEASFNSSCFDMSHMRFFVLFLISVITIIYTATFTLPSPLESVIEQTLNIHTHQFEYLFSSCSLAGAFSCILSGVLADKYLGYYTGSMLFAVIALCGQILVTIGGFLETFWLMLVGRFILGCGIESLAVVLNCYAVVWFQEKELSFVFGFFLMFGKGVGTSLAFYVGSPLYHLSQDIVKQSLALGVSMTPYLIAMLILILGTILLGKLTNVYYKKIEKFKSNKENNLKQILTFPFTFWILLLMLSFCMVSVTTFVPCSQKLMSEKFSLDSGLANKYCTLISILVAFLTPLFGLIVGRTGYYLYYDLVGIIFGVSSFVIFLTSNWSPFIFIILYSLQISMVNSCSWNLVIHIVDEYQLASAYGTLSVVIHGLTTISNTITGYLLEKYGSNSFALLLLSYSLIGLGSVVTLIILNKLNHGVLNLSAYDKESWTKKLNESLS